MPGLVAAPVGPLATDCTPSPQDHYTEKEAHTIMETLAAAVHFCHAHDVVHRDLKVVPAPHPPAARSVSPVCVCVFMCVLSLSPPQPENILLSNKTAGAVIKLCDFGFAKHCVESVLMTRCGSPGYVAPEVIEGKPYGKAADVWSLGIVYFILLSGNLPFNGMNMVRPLVTPCVCVNDTLRVVSEVLSCLGMRVGLCVSAHVCWFVPHMSSVCVRRDLVLFSLATVSLSLCKCAIHV